jgi:replication initiation and membrane attachment protein DnaB
MILLRIDLTLYLAVLFVACVAFYEYMLSDLNRCGYLSRFLSHHRLRDLNSFAEELSATRKLASLFKINQSWRHMVIGLYVQIKKQQR